MPEGSHKVRPTPGPEAGPARPAGRESGPGDLPRSDSGAADPRRGWTLRQRLALVYGAVSLVVLLGAAAFAAWQASTLSARNADLALAETRRVADRVGSALGQARQGVSVLATADPLALGADGCDRLLNAAQLTMDAIVSHLFVFDADRRIACSTLASAIGRQVAPPVVVTAELTGRPVTGALNNAAFGLGADLGVGHPILRGARHAGVVTASISLPGLRATATRPPPEVEGMRVWLLDPSGTSVSLIGPEEPLPPLPEALHASFAAPLPAEAGIAAAGNLFLLEARATDDLSLVAAIPLSEIQAGGRADVVLPPLLLAAVLMCGMAALFWSAERFVVAPLEAATRRLEAPDLPFAEGAGEAGAGLESGAADIAALIRRLGAARSTRDEAIRLRDLLLREAHHRIKNHLALVASFLRLQERQLSDHASLQALRTAQDRVVAIANTYELLHDGGGDCVSLDQTLERFARALAARDGMRATGEQDQAVQVQEVQGSVVVTDLAPVEVPADIAVKLALVVNELATNALKYAFPEGRRGTVRIVLRPTAPGPAEGAGFTLHISDDGKGMPPVPRRGLGMTVVDTLLRGIGATIERLPGPGTAFLIAWAGRPPSEGGA